MVKPRHTNDEGLPLVSMTVTPTFYSPENGVVPPLTPTVGTPAAFAQHGHSHGGVGAAPCGGLNSDAPHTHHQALKTFNAPAVQIGFFASFVFITNNIIGPGALALPFVFETAGWALSSIVLVFLCVTSGLCATLFLQAQERLQDDAQAKRGDGAPVSLEFSNIVDAACGRSIAKVSQLFYFLSIVSQLVASIIVTAQVTDNLFMLLLGRTYGFQFAPKLEAISFSTTSCHAHPKLPCSPFVESDIIFTLGYAVSMVFIMPIGFLKLGESMAAQVVSWIVATALIVTLVIHFGASELHPEATVAWGSDMSHVLGVVMFNLAFLFACPSWANERKPSVSVNGVVWSCIGFAIAVFLPLGLLGAWRYEHASGNILNVLAGSTSSVFTRVIATAFAVSAIGLGIPTFSIVLRYNLESDGILSQSNSKFVAVVLPWLICWLLYNGKGFLGVLNWSGLFINGIVNYILPLVVCIKAMPAIADRPTRIQALPPLLRAYQPAVLWGLLITVCVLNIACIVLSMITS